VLLKPAPSPVIIFDWETAGIAPPGVSLRRFEKLDVETRVDLAQHYVDYLEAKGISVALADVLFVMCTTNVFERLTRGVLELEVAPKLARKKIWAALTRAPYYSSG
jgi:hypothetical protein